MRQQLAAGLPGAGGGGGAWYQGPREGAGPARVTALHACCGRPTQETASWKESDRDTGAGSSRRRPWRAGGRGGVWGTDLEPRSAAALPPAARQGAVTTLREAGRETAQCCLRHVALIGLVTKVESREGATLGPSEADRATAWGPGSTRRGSQQQGRENGISGQLFPQGK